MKQNYYDIIEKLGEPLWYDNFGVPRYADFKPEMAGIYSKYVALLEVKCQCCQKVYRVASVVTEFASRVKLPIEKDIGSFAYGDPPHCGECKCPATNAVPVKILQLWEKKLDEKKGSKKEKWVRLKDHEVCIHESWCNKLKQDLKK